MRNDHQSKRRRPLPEGWQPGVEALASAAQVDFDDLDRVLWDALLSLRPQAFDELLEELEAGCRSREERDELNLRVDRLYELARSAAPGPDLQEAVTRLAS